MVKSYVRNASVDLLSMAEMTKLNEPDCVGLPESNPVEANASPGGKLPDATDHVSGVVPPVAANTVENGVLTEPCGSGFAVEIVKLDALMVSENVLRATVFALSVTRTSKENVPDWVVVPEINPDELTLIPDGSVPVAKAQE